MAFLLNGLGAVLEPLREQLDLTRGDVAFYPSLFAGGLVIVGLIGGSAVARVGRSAALNLSIGGMLLGGLLFSLPGRLPSLLGVFLIGLGAAMLIQLVPALLTALHPSTPTAAVGEVNGFASAASVVAPLAVAWALAIGAGWRAGYLLPPLAVLLAVLVPLSRATLPPMPAADTGWTSGSAALFGHWLDLMLAVSVEFCMVFWAASAIAAWHSTTLSQAPAVAAAYLVGMAICRSLASPITRLVGRARTLIMSSVLVASFGFGLFWLAPSLALAGAGLLVTGLGVALLYPTTVTRLIATWPEAPDRAAARAALGSGVAIGGAPFVLGRLSDAIGLRAAYLIVPLILAVLALHGMRHDKARE